jgi:uncharacterized protein YacL
MKNILLKYPNIYLLLFCAGSLVIGFEVGDIINNGLPARNIDLYLRVGGIVLNLFLALYFFYCFVQIKNKRVEEDSK